MKRTDPQHIAKIIDSVMLEGPDANQVLQQRASYLWVEIVGPGINRYTTRRYVKDGVLHVYLSSAPLKNELSFNRRQLVEQLNRAVGSNVITDIEFH